MRILGDELVSCIHARLAVLDELGKEEGECAQAHLFTHSTHKHLGLGAYIKDVMQVASAKAYLVLVARQRPRPPPWTGQGP